MSFVERRIELDELAAETSRKGGDLYLAYLIARRRDPPNAEALYQEYLACGPQLTAIRRERHQIESYLYDHPEILYKDRS
jgi:hypothetical protein